MDIYYDDQKNPIATTLDELIIYFKSFEGTSVVQNVPYALSCPMPAIISVISSSPRLPKFIYKNGTNPANRILQRQLSSNVNNLNALCNGVNSNTLVPVPEVGDIQDDEIIVQIPDVGTITDSDANSYILSVTGFHGWVLDPSYSSAVNDAGLVTLNISVTEVGASSPVSSEVIALISAQGIPNNTIMISSVDNATLPTGSILYIDDGGKLVYSGPVVLGGGSGTIEFFGLQYNINN